MNKTTSRSLGLRQALPVFFQRDHFRLLMIGSGGQGISTLLSLEKTIRSFSINIVDENLSKAATTYSDDHSQAKIFKRKFLPTDLADIDMVIIASENEEVYQEAISLAKEKNILIHFSAHPASGDIYFGEVVHSPGVQVAISANGKTGKIKKQLVDWLDVPLEEKKWKNLTSKLVLVFALMVVGHIIISYLPLPSFHEVYTNIKPYFNYQFLLFVLTGFCAQMVDGILSMGYGVTSATCLMSFGIPPISVSAAIHTSEVFTTGISGYSHYKFGNVNKKMFRHLVIPGVIGAVLGALLLVFLGEKSGKWLMPVIAVYAGFLGVKILTKAFRPVVRSQKVKRLGWLAWAGGFLDSFGGGGWGPIVTSSLIAKGRSPRYTVGSVSLAEFFITLASAATFFITAGISHWNIVLGLLIGGGIAAPIGARLAGRLPRKTMMIAVGIIVILWCIRMVIKSIGLIP